MRNLKERLDLCAVNTATLGHREPLNRSIDRIARAGFGGVAPWRHEVENANVNDIAKQIRALGLSVTGYCRSTYLPALTQAQFNANVEANKNALRDAATLGAKCFVMVVGGLPEASRDLGGARAQVSDAIAQLLESAREFGVPLALEPLHPMYAADRAVVNTLAHALEICDAVDPDASGFLEVAIDAYHCWWDPALKTSIEVAGSRNRILAYHVCDWLRETRDLLLDRGMMGDGVIDLTAMRKCVEDAGYSGPVEVEIFSKGNWWCRDPQEILRVSAERLQSVC